MSKSFREEDPPKHSDYQIVVFYLLGFSIFSLLLSSLVTAVVEGICAYLLWTGNKYARTIILLRAYATLIFAWFAYFLAPEIVGSREIVGAILLFCAPILLLLHGEYNNLRKRRIAVLLSIIGFFCFNKRIWNRRGQ
ncbi:MAG: hypothetical protein CBC35_06910 [Planctomycetes bacterium TMED75]|nr:MAG: hypothetical protein CBC35_06910 [Planctomycetes bacterium TMED75]